jgi:hypothetical protein
MNTEEGADMYKVHGFLDDKKIIHQRMEHLPRCGDTMRFSGERYGKVTEVIWAMDEDDCIEGQRINLRIESLKNTDTGSIPSVGKNET